MIEMGMKVKDAVTGFTGIVVATHNYLNGCMRVTVQPPVDKDGKLPDPATFDEPQLKQVGKKQLPSGSKKTGGPEKFSDHRSY